MKKILPIVLGVIGLGLVGFSLTKGWTGWRQSSACGMGITMNNLGYDHWQGLLAGAMALDGFAVLFFKPKLAAIFGLLASALSMMVYLMPPVVEGSQFEAQKAIFLAVAGGVVIALAGLIAPKRA